MSTRHAPLALTLCAALAACSSGGADPEPPQPSQLNPDNLLQVAALAQRAQYTATFVNQLFRIAAVEVLTDLPAKTSGACSGGGDYSYTTAAPTETLVLHQCGLKAVTYRKGTLTYVSTSGNGGQTGQTLTLTDVGVDQAATGLSFDVSGTVEENMSNAPAWRAVSSVKLSAGTRSDTWKYTMNAQPSGDTVLGELTLQTTRLPFAVVVQWTVGKQGFIVKGADGSSVTVVLDGTMRATAELRSAQGTTSQHSIAAADFQAALARESF